MRRAIVWALWHVCGIIDRIPEWSPEDRRWYRYGLGCRLGISGAALRLEERWGRRSMITRDDLPPTPDWSLPPNLHSAGSEALRLPLLYEGDQA